MLLDTSGLLCCLDADDARHADAVRHFDAAPRRVTHNYVLAELVALAHARRLHRDASLDFADRVMEDDDVEVIWVDPSLHRAAMGLLHSQLDKSSSLCDAVSFVIMQRRSLTDALATDQHFDQAGLRRLLPR